ncbi:hypothetical protein HK097_005301 [Rhizophlyctis rosea]|uniref:HNH nuclease domain-containing protein n=1 Tax=Rhizophlyctis rosea TaxID=64517 RepID=A0AAD5S0Q1_9FUNG|nr:hypothetical protein HK097_005301 [Rhizophlyctis rosea]
MYELLQQQVAEPQLLKDAKDALASFVDWDKLKHLPPAERRRVQKERQLLNAMLQHAPNQTSMAKAILVHDEDQNLRCLAQNAWHFYLLHRAAGGKTPPVNTFSSGTSSPLEATSESSASQNTSALASAKEGEKKGEKKNASRDQKVVQECYNRDRYTCRLTARRSVQFADTEGDKGASYTEAAHIIPFALKSLDPEEKDLFATMMTYFAPHIPLSLDELDVLENTIVLSAIAHRAFGEFRWVVDCAVNDDEKVTYTVHHLKSELQELNRVILDKEGIRFESTEGAPLLIDEAPTLPPPSPIMFYLHAALARVLHASGRAEELQRVVRDAGDDELFAQQAEIDKADIEVVQQAFKIMDGEGWVRYVGSGSEDWE